MIMIDAFMGYHTHEFRAIFLPLGIFDKDTFLLSNKQFNGFNHIS